MAKSTTIVRDDKQGAQPEKAITKAKADKLAERGQDSGQGNQLTGMYTRTADFLRDVRSEMRKVITPTRPEVQSTTLVVIGCVFIFAAYFALVDFFVGQGVTRLIQHFATKH